MTPVEAARTLECSPSYVRLIPLTQGLFTLVDAADFPRLSQYKWLAARSGRGIFYVQRTVWMPSEKRYRKLHMHRVILGVDADTMVDHANGDGLDNRRSNLRPATPSQNAANMRRQSRNTSGYRGVSYQPDRDKWRATIRENGVTRLIGAFSTAEEAAQAWDAAARAAFGVYAKLNFPSGADS